MNEKRPLAGPLSFSLGVDRAGAELAAGKLERHVVADETEAHRFCDPADQAPDDTHLAMSQVAEVVLEHPVHLADSRDAARRGVGDHVGVGRLLEMG